MSTETKHNVDIATDSRAVDAESRGRIGRQSDRVRPLGLAIAFIATAIILAVYLLRLDASAGGFKDDGWYVVLAKSLATGNGYSLVNLPGRPGMYLFPPFFPLLLSWLFRISPIFPGNVFLLKSLSIASMLLVSVLLFRFFHREDRLPRSLAYLLAFTAAVAPSFVMLATSTVMSECVFTTLQFATLLLAERYIEKRLTTGVSFAFVVAVPASAAYLTRTIGIALIAAVALGFLTRKMFKPLAIFLVASLLCVAPWIVYKHLPAASGADSGPIVTGYSPYFWSRLAGSAQPGTITPWDLPARFWQTSTVIAGDDVGGLLLPSLYRAPSESGEELIAMTAVIPSVSRNAIGLNSSTMGLNAEGQLISLGLSVVVLIGFVTSVRRSVGCPELFFAFSLLMIIAWPWPPIRYLVPLLPFFLYYLLVGVSEIYRPVLKRIGRPAPADHWTASRIVLLLILGLFLFDNGMYIAAMHLDPNSGQYPDWLRQSDAAGEAAEWIRNHTSDKEIVSGDNLPVTYLYSHRLTEMCFPDRCSEKGIRYYLASDGNEVPVGWRVVFQSRSRAVKVLEIPGTH